MLKPKSTLDRHALLFVDVAPQVESEKINLNIGDAFASQRELYEKAKAKAIVAYRQSNGLLS